jgi:hypothetical protein
MAQMKAHYSVDIHSSPH